MAGEDGTTSQYKTLVADILHGGPHGKFGARYEASAVLHIPRVMAGSHYGKVAQVELNKSQSTLALFQASQYLPDTWLCCLLSVLAIWLVHPSFVHFLSMRINKHWPSPREGIFEVLGG